MQATDGNFYGTTSQGGANGWPGTVFKITPGGKLTTLHSFDTTDGENPDAGLVQATDGNLYGTTTYGGANSSGTVFEITPKGKLTTLYSFCSETDCADGDVPTGGVFQATNGVLYGTTQDGGPDGDEYGTVFSLSMGLGPFVAFVRGSGKVGATVEILGQGFTGTTGVSFNRTPAQFQVVSDAYLTATVPNGATTGTVQVTTPGGTLTSNKVFRVTPQILSFQPTSGSPGTQVTITGVSLTQTSKVTFGGVKATNFTVNSDTQVTATVPSGAKTGRVGITTAGGTAASAGTFSVTPVISSFTPTSGPVGTSVTIYGTSFTGTTSVTFNGLAAAFTVNSDTQVTATVPQGATTGPIGITTPRGTATSSTNFTVT